MRATPRRLVLLGHPVAHSRSPAMQNAALRAAGIPLVYEALDVPADELDRVLASLVADHAAGNVTIPHKARAAAVCERLMPAAARTGAVNTFWVHEGRLVGDNTDVAGFDEAVWALLGGLPSQAVVAVFGAGGAAAGVLAALERWEGCRVRLYNRTAARAEQLASRFAGLAEVASSAEAALAGATLIVNATPIGLSDDRSPVLSRQLEPGAAVVDLVYRRGGTPLVRAALAAGHPATDGLPMLVGQGALAFERWFGLPPDRRVMWESLGDYR